MAETATSWLRRGAWTSTAEAGSFGRGGRPGVVATLLDGFGLASLFADDAAELSRFLERILGVGLPGSPSIVFGQEHDLIWVGPGQWLLRAASRDGFTELLGEISPRAAISDQSDGRVALRLTGPHVRDVLAKGVMLDLHPAAFAVGDAASTSIAYVGVQLWRLPDGPDGAVFELMAPRSMAGSFWSWFTASAAEFGCSVKSAEKAKPLIRS